MAEKPMGAFLIRPRTSKRRVTGAGRWSIDFLTLPSLLFGNCIKIPDLEASWFSKQAEKELVATKDIAM